ncbi:TetR/AcrR family transcriptional regulator [Nocardia sp. NPDC051052]|uniref:TetR/AcrR family transcriptional regulator n=1 Tax=Nocardia sp. NPDC051052 TaxID=3364322 RepID=UPI0037B8828F
MNAESGQPAPNRRAQLIEASIQLLEQVGPEGLRARTVAAEIGVSTMAVYTYFGGMNELLEAVAAEAFARFGAVLAVPDTDDPVADFFVAGAAYYSYALANPQRYRLMFGLVSPQTTRPAARNLSTSTAPAEFASGTTSFNQMLHVVEQMVEAGRIRADPVADVAGRLWSLMHGVVLLEITGYLGGAGQAVTDILGPATVDLLVGMGDERSRIEQSRVRANQRLAEQASGTL